jgi:hypothetical protein
MHRPQPQPNPVTSAERRLQRKLGPGVHIVAWGRAWVSRDGRMHTVFAARTFDFVVCTDDRLVLYSTGFFTRRPRRKVYEMTFDRLRVEPRQAKRGQAKRGSHLRLRTTGHRPLLFDMGTKARNTAFATELLARTRRPES